MLRGAVVMVGLILAGYMAGRAQTTTPAFEIVVDAPGGETFVRCVKGCTIKWVERGNNPASKPIPAFRFACNSGTGGGRCSSGRIGGWLEP